MYFGIECLYCWKLALVLVVCQAHIYLFRRTRKWLESFLESHINEVSFENLNLRGVVVPPLERDLNHEDYFLRLEILVEFFQHLGSLDLTLLREERLKKTLNYVRVDVESHYTDGAFPRCGVILYWANKETIEYLLPWFYN